MLRDLTAIVFSSLLRVIAMGLRFTTLGAMVTVGVLRLAIVIARTAFTSIAVGRVLTATAVTTVYLFAWLQNKA